MLIQILLNVHRGEHVSAFELSDVMAWLGHREAVPPKPQPTVEELKSKMELLHGLYSMGQNGQTE